MSSGDAIYQRRRQGWEAEGFVNIPLSPIAAVRIVGWDEHDPGYINNVARHRCQCRHHRRRSARSRPDPAVTGLTIPELDARTRLQHH